MPTTRNDVVRAAVEVLEERGLDGLTLREVAARLGVSAPTLYWHVRDKRHLLDLVAERWMRDYYPEGREVPAPGQPVEEWLADDCRKRRAALLSHRDSVQVVAGNRPTEEALPAIERTIGVLVAAGLEPGEAVRLLTAIGSFLLGEVLESQAAADRPVPEGPVGEWLDRFPMIKAAAAGAGSDDDRFEYGLGLLMAGLRARLAEGRRPNGAGATPAEATPAGTARAEAAAAVARLEAAQDAAARALESRTASASERRG